MSGAEQRGATRTRIALLPEVVRNQIAAGEVIERPASVVKELVENAIDAGARALEIELAEGGMALVRVRDDGGGMPPEDLELAFVPHATSKLRETADLEHIVSLGFRGEALASMGAVARCSIVSRVPDRQLGARIENEGGRITGPADCGAPLGTTVEVRDLFYNTPARRHFLKRAATELARCLDVVQRAALATEGVGFVVLHDGKRVLDVEPDMDLRARIRRVFGSELAAELVEVSAGDDELRVEGFVAPPRFSRRDASRQMFFLNGRSVRDKLLVRAVLDSYRGFLVEGRQPVAFLRLAMDPSSVDVNVHPTKSEVRFRDSRRVIAFLVHHLREAVRTTDMSTPGDRMIASAQRREDREAGPGLAFPRTGPAYPSRQYSSSQGAFVVRDVAGRPLPTQQRAPQSTPPPTAASSPEVDSAGDDDVHTGPVLQVARTFLIREVHDAAGGFEIVDQHALHERITFEALRCEVRAGKVEIQRFLMPELVEVGRADVKRIEPHLDELRSIGVDLSIFGEATLAVSGLPARLRRPDAQGLVNDLCAILEETGRPPRAEDVIEEVLHSMACRSSVMAGDELNQESIAALFARGRELESDQTCPHARPTRVRFTIADLEKAFHRR